MRAGRYDFTLEQNATFRTLVTWNDSTDAHDPVPLADFAARLQIRSEPGGEVYLDLSSETGQGIVLEPSGQTGAVDITITAEQALSVPAPLHGQRKMYYDLRLNDTTTADPAVRLLEGFVTVSPAVTVAV